MRITLNLASRPYLELRPVYQRLRLVMLLLALLTLGFWWLLRTEHGRAAQAQARVDSIRSSMADVQHQRQQAEAAMRQPANAAVLQQAQFLNNVYLRKAFSWTAVMMDLEQVLPSGVQVMNIDPQIAKDGRVAIRMRVAGPRERAVDLMRNLERSHRFLQPRLVGESAQTSSQAHESIAANGAAPSGVNFDILADYNPLPEQAKAAKGGSGAAGTNVPHRRVRRPKPNPAPEQGAKEGAAR